MTGGTVNQLQTFWSQQQFQLNPGLDFNPSGTSGDGGSGTGQICAKQLDHGEFSYTILIVSLKISFYSYFISIAYTIILKQ